MGHAAGPRARQHSPRARALMSAWMMPQLRRWYSAVSSCAAYARTAPMLSPMPRPYFLVSSRRLMSCAPLQLLRNPTIP